MIRVLILALVAGLLGAQPSTAQPQRVVSINLCADQLLVALAEPNQIAGLSPLARDPSLSFVADKAKTLPVLRSNAEAMVKMGADLVLVGPYDNRYLKSFITEKGVPMVTIGHWSSLAQGRAEIATLAAALGQQERGAALIASIDQALADTRAIAPKGASSVILHRRGYVSGAESVSAEIAAHMGLTDQAHHLGLSQGGFVPLEGLIAAKPDFIIVSRDHDTAEDQGTALLHHPALRALYPAQKQIVLPDRLTICGGPATPDLIHTFAKELRAKAR
jgi:iron complex transport system substrate-binding protein